ncbi:UNVERIFIED_ORG: hypothetical protein J2806_000608 [Kosakonia oryzae]|uniref:Fumarase D n=1 Tax=Kosakonia radicincitans TaxID=283686 RepID=A0AAX2ELR3_9ENTR|nr:MULTISPECIES: hypothetical protein [Kosakonia]MDP9564975.1 hypothetical protein [Kosakonia oryzae]APG17034.1 hypothetical protein A3780_05480 [Kosakonia radicincitans]KDE33780.1 hypothetical protein AW40_25985 [Kosakonia radicincitans UMEnt01/12]NCF04670.1 hypothetical protein [Kosakonia sp. MH5]SFD92327.1 hypothetical protein SAMN03159468_00399 [Kosakonia radicincitans]
MQTNKRDSDEMAKAIGYVVMELARTGCAITEDTINARLDSVLHKNASVANESVELPKPLRFNESLCG